MSESRDILKQEFQDEEYRYAYAEDFLNTSVATQIRVLRELRNNMTQEALGSLIGTKQAGISRLENVNYSAWKTETLRKIARALGVRLKITFETFGTLLDEATAFSKATLERPDFFHDPAFSEPLAVPTFEMEEEKKIFDSMEKQRPSIEEVDAAKFELVSVGGNLLGAGNVFIVSSGPAQATITCDSRSSQDVFDGNRFLSIEGHGELLLYLREHSSTVENWRDLGMPA